MKIFLSYGHDSNAPLIARNICLKTKMVILKREQYEETLQQLSDSIMQMKGSHKSFFGLFKINESKLNEEFCEFVKFMNLV